MALNAMASKRDTHHGGIAVYLYLLRRLQVRLDDDLAPAPLDLQVQLAE
jgi:hypothetical protein